MREREVVEVILKERRKSGEKETETLRQTADRAGRRQTGQTDREAA
jgi:hypothetical protein